MDIQTMVYKIFERARDPRRSLLWSNSDHCAYRSHDGLACFVGVLIHDDRYHPGLEGRNAKCLIDESDALPIPSEQYEPIVQFLSKAQQIHDYHPPQDWQLLLTQAIHEIIREHNLDILVPEEP